MSVMTRVDVNKVAIQLWIGTNTSSDDEYLQYFEEHETDLLDFVTPSCLFCADIGELNYMPKRLVVPQRYLTVQQIEHVLNDIAVNEEEKPKINERCKALGITSANAVFWYINNDVVLDLEVQQPYKDSYNGLKYIGEFNANTRYPLVPYDPTSNSHLWIGTTYEPADEFNTYFELDYSEEDMDSPNYKICGFCKDTGNIWYDEDFIGYPDHLKEEVDIGTLVDELIDSDLDCREQIVNACHELGITKANAVIWYTAESKYDSEFTLHKPYKDSYNGLKYVGVFKF
ncbi:hypothetical protein BOCO_0515 [Bombiscardovia coagulans]|uniref:Immunity protein 22 n=2 Tax=Bombiscardovia coagulans TaxID=686666 RepID=A0A261ET14_9BIFI|nr:hypothetical protein BOCO_0515 [Bombiscardovia coagulans]